VEKMDKCPTVELGVSTTHLKKEKKKIAHVLPKQKSKKRRDSNMRSNEKTITIIYSITHAHLYLIIC